MIQREFFPPTQQELEEMIYLLQKKLEDPRYSDEWKELYQELKEREKQLEEMTNDE